MALQLIQEASFLSSSGCEQGEWNEFVSQFMKGTETDARNVLLDYLSGKRVRKIEGEELAAQLLPSRMMHVLKTYISESFVALNSSSIDGAAFVGWKRRIQRVRTKIPSGTLLGSTQSLFNALYGPVRLGLVVPGISEHACLHTNDHIDERLELWKKSKLSGLMPRRQARFRSGKAPGLYSEPIEPMEIAGLPIKISCAHAQGDRLTQEDGHAIGKICLPYGDVGYFTIFDGHSGGSLTKFLQTYFAPALREHLEITPKSFKELDKREIENLLSTFPVRLQQWWKQNRRLWAQTHLLDDQADLIREICFKAWERMESLLDPNKFPESSKNVASETEEIISTTLWSWIKEVLPKQPRTLKDIKQQAAFFDLIQALIVEERKKILKLEGEEGRNWLRFFFHYLGKRLTARKADWRYDPGAVLASAFILEGKDGPMLWTVEVGDSPIFVLQDGKIFHVTEEASLEDEQFRKEVESRGGKIWKSQDGFRLCSHGGYNIARSLGDFGGKGLSPQGKVQRFPLHPPATVIMGSDGLIETLSYIDIGCTCQDFLSTAGENIAAEVAQYVYSWGSLDNISCTVVQILPRS
jgi:serine/threonine protein phosphatase PrpC